MQWCLYFLGEKSSQSDWCIQAFKAYEVVNDPMWYKKSVVEWFVDCDESQNSVLNSLELSSDLGMLNSIFSSPMIGLWNSIKI